jgi:hypothetical protein
MTAAEIAHEVILESLDLRTQDIAPVTEHTKRGLADGFVDLGTQTSQVKKGNGHEPGLT